MTTAPTAGESIHFVRSGFSFLAPPVGLGETSRRGQTVTVTDLLVELNSDRSGESFLHLNPEEQVDRYGYQIWASGPAPETLSLWQPGTVEEGIARDERRRQAALIADPITQAAAMREIQREFPQGNPSNQRSSFAPDDETRDRELRAAGLK